MGDTRLEQLAKTTRNPIEETEYRNLLTTQSLPYFQGGNATTTAQFRAATAGGTTGTSPTDLVDIARQLQGLREEANRPAVSSLEASIPETQTRYAAEQTRLAGEKQPLKNRYQGILDEIIRRENVDVSAQQQVTSREFGKRGIPLSSGLFDVELQKGVSPVRQFYTGQTTQTGLEREAGVRKIDELIANVTGQGVESVRAIRNAIAQLQSGAGQEAISGALSLYNTQQQSAAQTRQAELDRALQTRELEEYKIPSLQGTEDITKQYTSLSPGSTLFNLLTGQPIYKAPFKPIAGGDGAIDLETALEEYLNQNQ